MAASRKSITPYSSSPSGLPGSPGFSPSGSPPPSNSSSKPAVIVYSGEGYDQNKQFQRYESAGTYYPPFTPKSITVPSNFRVTLQTLSGPLVLSGPDARSSLSLSNNEIQVTTPTLAQPSTSPETVKIPNPVIAYSGPKFTGTSYPMGSTGVFNLSSGRFVVRSIRVPSGVRVTLRTPPGISPSRLDSIAGPSSLEFISDTPPLTIIEVAAFTPPSPPSTSPDPVDVYSGTKFTGMHYPLRSGVHDLSPINFVVRSIRVPWGVLVTLRTPPGISPSRVESIAGPSSLEFISDTPPLTIIEVRPLTSQTAQPAPSAIALPAPSSGANVVVGTPMVLVYPEESLKGTPCHLRPGTHNIPLTSATCSIASIRSIFVPDGSSATLYASDGSSFTIKGRSIIDKITKQITRITVSSSSPLTPTMEEGGSRLQVIGNGGMWLLLLLFLFILLLLFFFKRS